MAPMRFVILIIFSLLLAGVSQAQIGQRIKDKVKNETNYQINKKVDQATDKAIREVDTLLTGKKKKQDPPPAEKPAPGAGTGNSSPAANPVVSDTAYRVPESPRQFATRMNTVNATMSVFTNCRCEAGKKAAEKSLSRLKGMVSVSVNASSGEIRLAYNSAELSYATILQQLNDLGFEADGKPATPGKKGCN